mmetsp:Transcript_790/g.726  ORF Transcript_790/g.726 Transcript_790/m.726 type:complete len:122 (+) Transcript_790:162-527(+)
MPFEGQNHQLWDLKQVEGEDNSFFIACHPVYSNNISDSLVLEVNNGSIDNSAKIVLGAFTGEENQKFQFEKKANSFYAIKCKGSKKYFDVQGGDKSDGINLIQYTYHGGPNQLFSFGQCEE